MRLPIACSLFLLAVIFSACASAPPPGHVVGYSFPVADKAAKTALALVGKPYKFKGDSPEGFDCSGLVRYSYLTAGLDLPHGTAALKQRSTPVSFRDIRKGDLLFFTQYGKKYSHVGISTGRNEFVHAPSSGKAVRVDSLDDPYWKDHFLGARRL